MLDDLTQLKGLLLWCRYDLLLTLLSGRSSGTLRERILHLGVLSNRSNISELGLHSVYLKGPTILPYLTLFTDCYDSHLSPATD